MSTHIISRSIHSLVLFFSLGAFAIGCEETMVNNEADADDVYSYDDDEANVFVESGEFAETSPVHLKLANQTGLSNTNIIGGSTTDITEVPWQVAIKRNGGCHCGGSIVGSRWILTAAHCIQGYTLSTLSVVAGVSRLDQTGGQTRTISTAYVHPDYNSTTIQNDIALVYLSSALDLSGNSARAIRIGTLVDATAFEPNQMALISGWGRVSSTNFSCSNDLRSVTVPIIPNPIADDIMIVAEGLHVTADMLSTLGDNAAGAFKGDSGGPLVVDTPRGPMLAGNVSWGSPVATVGEPNQFSRVSYFADWIADHMNTDKHIQWIVDTNRDGSTDLRKDYGLASDRPIPADYNGDGVDDLALLRVNGSGWQWIIDTNRDGTTDIRVDYGSATDIPVVGDYNGDGKADFAFVRAVGAGWQWIIDTNRNGTTDMRVDYGKYTDRLVPADYNNDGKTDFGLLRLDGSGWQWIIDTNRDGVTDLRVNYGASTDGFIPADYNADGKADFGLLRVDGSQWQWIIDTNRDGSTDIRKNYGDVTDATIPADYSGDNRADFGLLRVNGSQWQWIIDTNRDGTTDIRKNYGNITDAAFTGDFNGDNKADFTLIRVID